MIKSKLNFLCFITGMATISMTLLSAADCIDDATGTYTGSGLSCNMVINTFGQSCDSEFMSVLVSEECPVSCDACETDPSGCDLPDMSLSFLENGSVLYNTSVAIGGFQFIVEGVTVNGASGGEAESQNFTVSTNNVSGQPNVLGFS